MELGKLDSIFFSSPSQKNQQRKSFPTDLYIYFIRKYATMEKNGTIIAATAIVGLFLIGTLPFILQTSETPTGAVSGESYKYEMCLVKYGRDSQGNLDYEKIKQCRENVRTTEKVTGGGNNKGTPRLYLSSDRTAFQNQETIEG